MADILVAVESTTHAKGDLIVGTDATTVGRLPVGSDGQVLTADSSEPTGLKYATPSGTGGGVATALHLPGLTTDKVSTPHVAGAHVGDVIDIRVDLDPDTWAPSTSTGIAGKGTGATAATSSFQFSITASNMVYVTVSDGTSQITRVVSALTGLSGRARLRVVYTRDTGAGQYLIAAFTSQDFTDPLGTTTTWDTKSTQTGASIGATNDTGSVLVGQHSPTVAGMGGLYYGAAVLVGGVLKTSWDGSWPHARQYDPVGEAVWTVEGTSNGWKSV